ncbi:MAG TPA: rubrerythrin family protein [Terriglobales bacterium]
MSTTAVTSNETTLKNLMTAFNGESNASAKYAAFAKKADQEGFGRVASLFRAASRAEQIHAANHARVIEKLGGKAVAKIDPVQAGTTAENLRVAIAGEEYERDVMYPDFIKEAESQKNTAAIRTFQWALEAEAEHARMYTYALRHLNEQRTKTVFYVCAACGYTTDDQDMMRCAVCNAPKEKFERIE